MKKIKLASLLCALLLLSACATPEALHDTGSEHHRTIMETQESNVLSEIEKTALIYEQLEDNLENTLLTLEGVTVVEITTDTKAQTLAIAMTVSSAFEDSAELRDSIYQLCEQSFGAHIAPSLSITSQ